MNSVKVSVIVPVYNVENYLSQCLDSILNQTLKEIEIICVNDGSKDNSSQILEEYAQKDDRIKIITKENKGLGAARNTGMDYVTGEYIGFVDSDDWIDLTMYEKLYKNAKSQNSDMVMCPLHIYDDTTHELEYRYPYFTLEYFDEHFDDCTFDHSKTKDFLFRICVTAPNKIYKTEFLKKNHLKFPEGLIFEDNPFFYEAYLKADRVSLIRDFLYFYRMNRADSILKKPDKKFFDLIKIHKLNKKIFIETNNFNDYKIDLLSYIISNIVSRYMEIDEIYKKEFFELIKQYFEDIDLKIDEVNELDPYIKNQYQNMINSDSYKEFELLEENYQLSDKNKQLSNKNHQLSTENKQLYSKKTELELRFLYEHKMGENLKQEVNELSNELNKTNKFYDKQVNSLKRQVNAYKSRKIVRFADKIWKIYSKPKTRSKTLIYVGITMLYGKLKPYPQVTTILHKTNNRFNLINKKDALKTYSVHKENVVKKSKPYKKLKKIKDIKVAVICDEFTYNCFKYEFNAIVVEPSNWLRIFEMEKPDLFFCESAWSGVDSKKRPWKGKISYNTSNKKENRSILLDIIKYCNEKNITTIFWNKEDPADFDKFYDTALKFDHIFTTEESYVQKYKEDYGHTSVHCLMFGAQPKLFNPIEKQERSEDIIFAGSWYDRYPERCNEMAEIFDNILDNGLKLKIYDRLYHLKDPKRIFPDKYREFINPPVPHDQIGTVYKESKCALNINTITNSNTMFARRVFELMLCNTLVLSNYSKGIHNLFGDNVVFVGKDKIDLSDSEKKRINNLYNVLKYHTYSNRFKQILDTINYEYMPTDDSITIYYVANNESEIESILEHYESINYNSKKLALLLSNQFPNHLIKNMYQKYTNDETSVYSLNYLLNQDGIILNNSPYFIFANCQLNKDFIEKAILHYSYIETRFGVALGNKFTFKKARNVQNVVLSNKNFIEAFNNIFKYNHAEFSVYTIQTSGNDELSYLSKEKSKVSPNSLPRNSVKRLIISYCFPPYADQSGTVMAKRVRESNEVVDVIQNDISDIKNVDKSLNFITDGLIEDRIVINSISKNSFGDWNLIYDFCKKGMKKINDNIKRKGEYKEIYSRSLLPASHFLAFECKLNYPNTKWIAEFSDPVLYDEKGKMRHSKINDQEFMDKVNHLLLKKGFTEYKQDNLFLLCEYLPYIFADELIFTNENQKEYMISKFPIPQIKDIIENKSIIKRHPTLKKEFYNLMESDYLLDDNYVNIAYFGRDYETRNLNDIFYALYGLDNHYKNKCKIHFFTSNAENFKKSLRSSPVNGNIEVNPYVNFLEFLNLTTKFDCLIVNDANKKGEINPYLPSKLSDYLGSGTDIWILYEEGSAMSKLDLKYMSANGNIGSTKQTLEQIIKDHS